MAYQHEHRPAGTVGRRGATPQAGDFLARGGASLSAIEPPASWGANLSKGGVDLTGVSHESEKELRDAKGMKYQLPGASHQLQCCVCIPA